MLNDDNHVLLNDDNNASLNDDILITITETLPTTRPLSDELLKEIEEVCQYYRDEHRRYKDELDDEPVASPAARVLDDASLPA